MKSIETAAFKLATAVAARTRSASNTELSAAHQILKTDLKYRDKTSKVLNEIKSRAAHLTRVKSRSI
ncbi:MAG: hypothetical protein ACWA40_10430 [Planktomarina sp.]